MLAELQEETWTAADAETMELPDSDERPKLNDPFAKLEHGNDDARRGRDARNRLTELYSDSAAKFQDDYATNKALRRAMRCESNLWFQVRLLCIGAAQ
jgi:Saf4/Yju2 protein